MMNMYGSPKRQGESKTQWALFFPLLLHKAPIFFSLCTGFFTREWLEFHVTPRFAIFKPWGSIFLTEAIIGSAEVGRSKAITMADP